MALFQEWSYDLDDDNDLYDNDLDGSQIQTDLILPLSYNKFQSNYTKDKYKEYNLDEYGGFNLSCGTQPFIFNNKIYNIFCLRYTKPTNTLSKVIPGNTRCPSNMVPLKDKGYNFVWNNWSLPEDNYIFIGEIINDKIIEVYKIGDTFFSDARIYYVNSINTSNNIHNYILSSRNLLDNDYELISINPKLENNKILFNIVGFRIPISNRLYNCISKNDINLPITNINIENNNEEYYKISLNYFKWFEKASTDNQYFESIPYNQSDILEFDDNGVLINNNNYFSNINGSVSNCSNNITEFSFFIYIPSFEIIQTCLDNLSLIKNIQKELEKINIGICVNKRCNLIINNEYLIGNQEISSEISTHGFSFGTHFVQINENEFIAVGHIKINSRNIKNGKVLYNKYSKSYKVQNKLYKFMNSLFGYNFKQNHSSFRNCKSGFSYFSYFILYNKDINTFHISDFFLTADMNDKYHFSLLFTIGIMKINDFIYITSGEGDYYNSIMKFNKNDIVIWCKYNALAPDFNINNINYSVIIKDFEGNNHNIVINDNLNIIDTVKQFTGIEMIQLNNPYNDLDSSVRYYQNKYIKYKNKYLKIKKK
jgi:hypothetical protein